MSTLRYSIAVFALAVLQLGTARAQNLVVSTLEGAGNGSLAALIASAPSGATITFDPSLHGTVLFGNPDIHRDLTIIGPADGSITVQSGIVFRIDTLITVHITNLILAGPGTSNAFAGYTGVINRGILFLDSCTLVGNSGTSGGAIFNSAGAIFNSGSLAATACSFTGNSGLGGAIFNTGNLRASCCSFIGNQNNSMDWNGITPGGAILNTGAASLVNCTISGNHIQAKEIDHINFTTIFPAFGAGVYNSGTLSIVYCTIVYNSLTGAYSTLPSRGAGVFNSGTLTLLNSIIALNDSGITNFTYQTDVDIGGPTTGGGHNLFGRIFTDDSNIQDPSNANLYGSVSQMLNPRLDTLATHGGPMDLWSLLPLSPAIGKAQALDSIPTDQRSYPRGLTPDIGSYQVNPVYPSLPTGQEPISPSRNYILLGTTDVFTWSRGTLAATYRIQIAVDSLFSELFLDKSDLQGNSFEVRGFSPLVKYFWRVAGINGLGQGSFSLPSAFQISGHPDSVHFVTPSGMSVDTDYVRVIWRRADLATSYHLAVTWTAGPTRNFIVVDTTYLLGLNDRLSTYIVSVNGVNAEGDGPVSSWSVIAHNPGLPDAPPLVSPPDGAIVSPPVRVVWRDNRREKDLVETYFWFKLNSDPRWLPETMIFDGRVNDSSITLAQVNTAGTYYWRVYSVIYQTGGDITSAQFTIGHSSDVFDTTRRTIPGSYIIYGNYPNPFNPETIVRFGIPEAAEVTLRVYSSDGQLVEELLHQTLRAGVYSVPWNATRCASGAYFLQMRAGNSMIVHRAMLIR